MKHLVGKVITKKVPFMGDEVEIRKLSVSEVLKVQEMVKKAAKSKNEDSGQLSLLRDVIRLSVIGAEDITDEDFNTFPIGELNDISTAILGYSGLGDATAGN